METSIFPDKAKKPDEQILMAALGHQIELWNKLREFVLDKYPMAIEEWNYPGKKYGWSFRMKDKKRAIIYLLPQQGCFKAAFVFGQKAVDQVLQSEISKDIKTELQQARVYAEGRGIRIEVKDESIIPDLKRLVEIKLAN